MRLRPVFTIRSIVNSVRTYARLLTLPEHPQRKEWSFAIATFGDGLSGDDAARLTNLCKQHRPYRLFLADTLTLSFVNSTELSFPHLDLPIEAETGGVDVEITGELSEELIALLWSVLTTTNVGFTNDFEKTFVYGNGTPPNLNSATKLESPIELEQWIKETVGSRDVY